MQQSERQFRCRYGIVTALPKEFAAMRAMLDSVEPVPMDADPNDYVMGRIRARSGGDHHIVLTLLKKMGTNSAASAATNLLRSFPLVTDVIMVGIAYGCPCPEDASKHVRLGDIVVSNEYGVLQVDNIKVSDGRIQIRDTTSKPSASLIGKVNLLEAGRLAGNYPWEEYVRVAQRRLEGVRRPRAATDVIYSTTSPRQPLCHPPDRLRRPGKPKLHYGRIASANTLLKDAKRRDLLRDKYGVRAGEMEGSGMADATWIEGKSYLLIRAICDYGDRTKVDEWQGYAAVVAAAYARALIETIPTEPVAALPSRKLDRGGASIRLMGPHRASA